MMATMITHRRVDVERDVDTLLELHSHANYASSSPWVRSRVSFDEFRDHWLATAQPKEFLGNLAKPWRTHGRSPSCGRSTVSQRGSYV